MGRVFGAQLRALCEAQRISSEGTRPCRRWRVEPGGRSAEKPKTKKWGEKKKHGSRFYLDVKGGFKISFRSVRE